MPRKKKKEPGRQRARPSFPARYGVGNHVRVRPGTTVPDFEDIPLGGWAGTIREVDQRSAPPTYLIEWNQRTLEHMHPVYRKRCERDGLGPESMWLGEDDLEADRGGPAAVEQPTEIRTRPLEADDQDDRVRLALGLTSDDPLPDVQEETLLAYRRHLAAQLSFPVEASWSPESGLVGGTTHAVTITGLGDPEADPCVDEMYGLLCEARAEGRLIEVPLAECEGKKGSPSRQLLKDYSYWFWNYR
jgi:hypothetical protein